MDQRNPTHQMSISQQDWSLHRKGPIDQARHNERVKEAIKDIQVADGPNDAGASLVRGHRGGSLGYERRRCG